MLASLATGFGRPIQVVWIAHNVDRVGEDTYCACFCSFRDLKDLIGGQLANSTPDAQRVMLFHKTLVGAEGTGFEHFRLRFGVAVTSGLVVNVDLFDTHTNGNEAVIKFQWISVEVLNHVGDGFGD